MPSIVIEEIKDSMLRSKDLFNNGVSITLDLKCLHIFKM